MPGPTIRQLKKDKRTKRQRQDDFLSWFSEYASVSRAAKKAKVHRSVIYDWLKKDKVFLKKYEAVCEQAVGALEDEAVRRAYQGVLKPVFYKGNKAGSIREYSDTLLIVLLKARAPEKYKDRVYNEQSGPNGQPIQTEVTNRVIFEDYGKKSD